MFPCSLKPLGGPQKVYRPYLESVVDHVNGRMESTDLISAMCIYDPRNLPIGRLWHTKKHEPLSIPTVFTKGSKFWEK